MTLLTQQSPSQPAPIWDAVPLQSQLFDWLGGIRHGITRRVPDALPAEANISFTAPRDQEAAWAMRQRWSLAIGVDASTLVIPRQVHGNAVVAARASDAGSGAAPGSSLIAEADAIISNAHGVALMTTHGDCLPILMYAPKSRAIAAVHAGWRSTVTNVAGNTVAAMTAIFGVQTSDIHVFFGPAICPSCYDVGSDVVEAWHTLDPGDTSGAVHNEGERNTFDLATANMALLQDAGIPIDQIDFSNICTKCNGDEWFSHRGQGPNTGRFGAIIALDSDTR